MYCFEYAGVLHSVLAFFFFLIFHDQKVTKKKLRWKVAFIGALIKIHSCLKIYVLF